MRNLNNDTSFMRMKIMFSQTVAVCLLFCNARAADSFKIDPAHSHVGFSIRHMGINNVRGTFDEYEGSVVIDDGKIKEADGTIQVKSVNTHVAPRDNHLRSLAFLDADKYPTITFKTKRVETSGAETRLIADFTMHGVTKELVLPVTLSGPVKDPQGNTRIGLEATAKVNRKDYGISYNQVLEAGIQAVGEEVTIEINAEAVKRAASAGKK